MDSWADARLPVAADLPADADAAKFQLRFRSGRSCSIYRAAFALKFCIYNDLQFGSPRAGQSNEVAGAKKRKKP